MRLAVNIDHIATIREARKSDEPDPIAAAVICELAGAQGITVHLRGDRRHMQDRDVEILKRTVSTHLNVEMAASPEMVRIAQTVKPHQVTLVPERRDELTTEGGLDVVLHSSNIDKTIRQLLDASIDVSIFVDPDLEQLRQCQKLRAPRIEINTGKYAEAWKRGSGWTSELEKVATAAKAARKMHRRACRYRRAEHRTLHRCTRGVSRTRSRGEGDDRVDGGAEKIERRMLNVQC
jgi:pyridoxine 5-phosphate synthase